VREENIYCVPFYRAPSEAATLANGVMRDGWQLREACKYSALFVGPLRTFGTIEFRHAPTFSDPAVLVLWWKLCQCVANSWQLPDPFEVYAEGGNRGVAKAVFGDLLNTFELEDWEIEALITRTGAEEVAFLFQPCTYKEAEWGVPGQFQITRAPFTESEADRYFDRLELTLDPHPEDEEQQPEDEDEFFEPEEVE